MMPEVIETMKLELARQEISKRWLEFGKALADGFWEGLLSHDDIYTVNWNIFNGLYYDLPIFTPFRFRISTRIKMAVKAKILKLIDAIREKIE